jgi:hypothetical protein
MYSTRCSALIKWKWKKWYVYNGWTAGRSSTSTAVLYSVLRNLGFHGATRMGSRSPQTTVHVRSSARLDETTTAAPAPAQGSLSRVAFVKPATPAPQHLNEPGPPAPLSVAYTSRRPITSFSRRPSPPLLETTPVTLLFPRGPRSQLPTQGWPPVPVQKPTTAAAPHQATATSRSAQSKSAPHQPPPFSPQI